MPTLNASSSVCETPRPRNRNSVSPCFVPAPPGVAGKSVASESTTCASSALWMFAVTPNAFRKKKSDAMRKTHEIACGRITPRSSRRRCPRIAKPWRTWTRNSSYRRRAQKKPTTASTSEDGERDLRRPRMAQEELPVDRRDPRVELARRQHADRERPDDQRAGGEEVEQRLDEQRRRERRVRRIAQPVLDEVHLHDVAAARRDDRVDADAREVGAERGPVLQPLLRIGGAHDRAPGARAEEQLDDVTGDCEPEELPLHRREVVEEDADRVEEVAHRRARVTA